jgi:hypothetical protein
MVVAGLSFPINEDIRQPANDRGVGITVPVFKAEKFSKHFQ